ncbi:hypothetical protein CHLRE_10g425150v5 [Chlamydomonas reinhardtii]|uniref:Uncharacterized protein n=1 Tax=Chlamydomonas reinhardtii TaxID=3055 RepID=A0A2K3D9G5_CHLRE|nr:uncharacterized protein CHLRE_10g425150v5 [Chlamydomonas reinhardtii]PNW77168.1 hypothetical protein CHLRE_10g425150v5 [Chlamydomonas reinhardtii]
MIQLAATPERRVERDQPHRGCIPWPGHAFVAHWGRPEPWRALALRKRERLLCLAASSGHAPSLNAALEHCGCHVPLAALPSAAAAGHVEACGRLRERLAAEEHQGWGLSAAVHAAAKAGHSAVLALLLGPTEMYCSDAALGACAGGHLNLLSQLQERYRCFRTDKCEFAMSAASAGQTQVLEALLPLQQARWEAAAAATIVGAGAGAAAGAEQAEQQLVELHRMLPKVEQHYLLMSIARGCPVAVLQRHFDGLWPWGLVPGAAAAAGAAQHQAGEPGPFGIPLTERLVRLLAAVIHSPTSCWAAKLDFLICRWGAELTGKVLRGELDGAYSYVETGPHTPDFTARVRRLYAAGMRPAAAGTPAGVSRLRLPEMLAATAVHWGDADALAFLWDECGLAMPARIWTRLLMCADGDTQGLLAVLRLLQRRGQAFTLKDLVVGASSCDRVRSELLVVQLIEATVDGAADPVAAKQHWTRVFRCLAHIGAGIPVLHALRARGAAVDLCAVAVGGSEEALEWAAAELEAAAGRGEAGLKALTHSEAARVTAAGNFATRRWLEARGLLGGGGGERGGEDEAEEGTEEDNEEEEEEEEQEPEEGD